MKRIACEMCGSSDVMKTEGFYGRFTVVIW